MPQGSVLGPLLFLISVNDIADSLLSLTRLFADDSSLFCSTSSLFDLQGIINHDLVVLSAWAKQWLITFNPTKTEAILFTLKHYQQLKMKDIKNADGFLFLLDDKNKKYHLCSKRLMVLLQIIYMN